MGIRTGETRICSLEIVHVEIVQYTYVIDSTCSYNMCRIGE